MKHYIVAILHDEGLSCAKYFFQEFSQLEEQPSDTHLHCGCLFLTKKWQQSDPKFINISLIKNFKLKCLIKSLLISYSIFIHNIQPTCLEGQILVLYQMQ